MVRRETQGQIKPDLYFMFSFGYRNRDKNACLNNMPAIKKITEQLGLGYFLFANSENFKWTV